MSQRACSDECQRMNAHLDALTSSRVAKPSKSPSLPSVCNINPIVLRVFRTPKHAYSPVQISISFLWSLRFHESRSREGIRKVWIEQPRTSHISRLGFVNAHLVLVLEALRKWGNIIDVNCRAGSVCYCKFRVGRILCFLVLSVSAQIPVSNGPNFI